MATIFLKHMVCEYNLVKWWRRYWIQKYDITPFCYTMCVWVDLSVWCDMVSASGLWKVPADEDIYPGIRAGPELSEWRHQCRQELRQKVRHHQRQHTTRRAHSAFSNRNFLNKYAVLPPNGNHGNWTGPNGKFSVCASLPSDGAPYRFIRRVITS